MVGTAKGVLCHFLIYCMSILFNAEKLLEGSTRNQYQRDAQSGEESVIC